MKYIIIFLFAATYIVNAQVDTSVYYPTHIGDKWEYWSPYYGSYQVEIIGDTLMPNGKKYFIYTLQDYAYQRVQNNKYVYVYNEYSVDSEFVHYNLEGIKHEIWELNFPYYRGIYKIGKDDNNLLQENLEWREYRDVFIDTTQIPPDTLWNEGIDAYWPRITKGLGITTYANGIEVLVGAVINGVAYGTLVGIKENKDDIVKDYKLFQNYPNPFNPSTKINFSIPESGNISLKIYSILGKEIATLVNERKEPGTYSLNFNASNLSSGLYIYRLKVNGFVLSKKMLFIK